MEKRGVVEGEAEAPIVAKTAADKACGQDSGCKPQCCGDDLASKAAEAAISNRAEPLQA